MVPPDSQKSPKPEKSSREDVIVVDGSGEARLQPTRERFRHARKAGKGAIADVVTEVEIRPGVVERVSTKRLADRDVLSLLLGRGFIDQEQYSVGSEFYKHWERSGLASAGVVDLERPKVDGGQFKPESDEAVWHLGVWSRMVRDLGSIHADVLCDCVLLAETLEDYGLRCGPYRNARKAREWAEGCVERALRQLVINVLGRRTVRTRVGMLPGARPVVPAGEPAVRVVEPASRPGARPGPNSGGSGPGGKNRRGSVE